MDYSEQFDQVLKQKETTRSFRWVMEKLVMDPESLQLRGMAAFTFLVLGKGWVAREMAQEVLSEDQNQDWALATLFASYRFDDLSQNPKFFENGVCRLGIEWIARFSKYLGDQQAEMLIYCLARYGTPAQKFHLLENTVVIAHKSNESKPRSKEMKTKPREITNQLGLFE